MCGRYANTETPERLAEQWHATWSGSSVWSPSFDVRPTQRAPIISQPGQLKLARWGWERTFASGGRIINARWESATEKRTFAHAVEHQRCVIPATAYYEWRRDERDRPLAKFAFRSAHADHLAMAGLCETITTPEGSEERFLILTRTMRRFADIHDRTPVLLSPAALEVWLDQVAPLQDVLEAANCMDDDDFVVRPVCSGPTKAAPAGPHLLDSIGDPW